MILFLNPYRKFMLKHNLIRQVHKFELQTCLRAKTKKIEFLRSPAICCSALLLTILFLYRRFAAQFAVAFSPYVYYEHLSFRNWWSGVRDANNIRPRSYLNDKITFYIIWHEIRTINIEILQLNFKIYGAELEMPIT